MIIWRALGYRNFSSHGWENNEETQSVRTWRTCCFQFVSFFDWIWIRLFLETSETLSLSTSLPYCKNQNWATRLVARIKIELQGWFGRLLERMVVRVAAGRKESWKRIHVVEENTTIFADVYGCRDWNLESKWFVICFSSFVFRNILPKLRAAKAKAEAMKHSLIFQLNPCVKPLN